MLFNVLPGRPEQATSRYIRLVTLGRLIQNQSDHALKSHVQTFLCRIPVFDQLAILDRPYREIETDIVDPRKVTRPDFNSIPNTLQLAQFFCRIIAICVVGFQIGNYVKISWFQSEMLPVENSSRSVCGHQRIGGMKITVCHVAIHHVRVSKAAQIRCCNIPGLLDELHHLRWMLNVFIACFDEPGNERGFLHIPDCHKSPRPVVQKFMHPQNLGK